MKLADKPCYPVKRIIKHPETQTHYAYDEEIIEEGLTFRERLIIALASNPNICANTDIAHDLSQMNMVANADEVVSQADAIIKEMEKQDK